MNKGINFVNYSISTYSIKIEEKEYVKKIGKFQKKKMGKCQLNFLYEKYGREINVHDFFLFF